MDPISGALVAGMFGAALEKAGEAAVNHLTDDAIDAGQGALGRLVAWVRNKFSGTKEVSLIEELVKLGYNKDEVVAALGAIIDKELQSNTVARKEISAIVDQVEQENPELRRNTANNVNQQAEGVGIVQAVNSTIHGITVSGFPHSSSRRGRHAH